MNDSISLLINHIYIVFNHRTYNKIYLHRHPTPTVPHRHSAQIFLTSDADNVLQSGTKQQRDAAEHANKVLTMILSENWNQKL